RSKAGSYALRAVYYDLPASTYINTTPELDPGAAGGSGFKGYTVGGSYILAKNIEFALDYFDFDSKKGDAYDNNLLWTRVFFYF
ncbi:MAG: hypothetical protein LBO03_00630, partial [Acidaminococcales bacterium]|nr:hypothetical protein [Acidaminococcales bacterium]